jgi:hypothetical protein
MVPCHVGKPWLSPLIQYQLHHETPLLTKYSIEYPMGNCTFAPYSMTFLRPQWPSGNPG